MNQNLTLIKSLLASHGLRPKHRFGQNFLHDGNQMQRILEAAAIEGDAAAGAANGASAARVLEVGAGTGALTERLLDAGARVVAVEIDDDLEPILRQRLASYGDRVTLVFDDVLTGKHTINPRVLELVGDNPFTLIANLPYNVASPLLVNLAVDVPAMRRAVIMVQREVADRLAAPPGGKDFGPLSIMVQAMCEVDRLCTVPPGCFWPQPKVDSAVVRLARRAEPLTRDPHRLAAFVQRLFQHRRKQLGAILGRDVALPPGIDARSRPEQLGVAQIVELAATATP